MENNVKGNQHEHTCCVSVFIFNLHAILLYDGI